MYIRSTTTSTRRKKSADFLEDTLGIGVWEWHKSLNAFSWNSAMFKLYGISEEDFDGKWENWCALLHPDDKDAVIQTFEQFLISSTPLDLSFRATHSNGKYRNIHMRSSSLVKSSTKCVGMCWQDDEYALLLDQLEKAHVSMDTCKISFLWFGEDGFVKMSNSYAHSQLGYSKEELLKLPIWSLDQTQSPAQWNEGWNRHERDGYLAFRTIYTTKQQEQLPVEVAACLIAVGDGKYAFHIVQDITAIVAGENALRDAKVSADKAGRAKAAFLANLAHEIRTPMNAIIGLSSLLLQKSSPESEIWGYLEKVLSSGRSLLTVLNEILEFSKLEADALELFNEPFEISAILSRLKENFLPIAREKGIQFDLQSEQIISIGLLEGDVMRLEQILGYIISHSIGSTRHGSVTLVVTSENDTPSEVKLKFSVKDTGGGLTEDEQSDLFRLFLLKGDYNNTSSGLGLAIAQKLAALLRSQIIVESFPQFGSIYRFTVTFPKVGPIDTVCKMGASSDKENQLLATAPQELTGKKLVLAEDNFVNQLIMKEMLKSIGITCDIANSGIEAVALAGKGIYDGILMDVQMPVMGGIEATNIIRQQERWASIPIIALTAGVTAHENEECLANGMNAVLLKPIDREALVCELLKWLCKGKGVRTLRKRMSTREFSIANFDSEFTGGGIYTSPKFTEPFKEFCDTGSIWLRPQQATSAGNVTDLTLSSSDYTDSGSRAVLSSGSNSGLLKHSHSSTSSIASYMEQLKSIDFWMVCEMAGSNRDTVVELLKAFLEFLLETRVNLESNSTDVEENISEMRQVLSRVISTADTMCATDLATSARAYLIALLQAESPEIISLQEKFLLELGQTAAELQGIPGLVVTPPFHAGNEKL